MTRNSESVFILGNKGSATFAGGMGFCFCFPGHPLAGSLFFGGFIMRDGTLQWKDLHGKRVRIRWLYAQGFRREWTPPGEMDLDGPREVWPTPLHLADMMQLAITDDGKNAYTPGVEVEYIGGDSVTVLRFVVVHWENIGDGIWLCWPFTQSERYYTIENADVHARDYLRSEAQEVRRTIDEMKVWPDDLALVLINPEFLDMPGLEVGREKA